MQIGAMDSIMGSMAEAPTIGRDRGGKFLPGNPSNGGRPRLADWYKSGSEEAMRVSYTAALGKLPPGENPPAALAFVIVPGAPDTIDPKLRLEQGARIMDRVLGKAPETLQVEGASAVMDLLVAMAKPVTTSGTDDP